MTCVGPAHRTSGVTEPEVNTVDILLCTTNNKVAETINPINVSLPPHSIKETFIYQNLIMDGFYFTSYEEGVVAAEGIDLLRCIACKIRLARYITIPCSHLFCFECKTMLDPQPFSECSTCLRPILFVSKYYT